MGLTIHWQFRAEDIGAREVRQKLEALRQTCMDMAFEEVGEIVSLKGKEADFINRADDDPLRWFLIQAQEDVPLVPAEQDDPWDIPRVSIGVAPKQIIGFSACPGRGCEEMNIFMACYPKTILATKFRYDYADNYYPVQVYKSGEGYVEAKCRYQTGVGEGWYGRSFCKTQYANDPRVGGVPHFLRCHMSVVKTLDAAKELGILWTVNDEGGFFYGRNISALLEELGDSEQMIAAIAGQIKDSVSGMDMELLAAILERQNFEHLEAKGINNLPEDNERWKRLLGDLKQIAAKQETE